MKLICKTLEFSIGKVNSKINAGLNNFVLIVSTIHQISCGSSSGHVKWWMPLPSDVSGDVRNAPFSLLVFYPSNIVVQYYIHNKSKIELGHVRHWSF